MHLKNEVIMHLKGHKQLNTAFSVIIVFSLCLDIALGVAFTECGSGAGSVLHVHVQDCRAADKSCQIKTQVTSVVRFGINFTTEAGIYDSVTSIGTAHKWGMHAQIFSNLDICNGSLNCPLQPDKHFYTDDILLPGWTPKGEANVQWRLTSGPIEILCVEVEVTLL